MNQSDRTPRWLAAVHVVLCFIVLIIVIIIMLHVKKLDASNGAAPTVCESCECPVKPIPGEPSGSPIDPEPDAVNLVGRTINASSYVNGVTVVLEENVGGSWKVRRTAATHYSQHDDTTYQEVGWYTFFAVPQPSSGSTSYRVCRLGETNMANCSTHTVNSTDAAGNYSLSVITVP